MKTDYWAKLEPNTCYHIYNRAVGNDNLFLKNEHYHYFLGRWEEYIIPYFSTYAYCLMPNHFHFLAKAKPLTPDILALIEKIPSQKASAFLRGEVDTNTFYTSQFKAMFNSYSGAFNKEQDRHGSLFQAKFKRIVIRDEVHFIDKLQYVHHNVIHHGFGIHYYDWPYSSYGIYIEQQPHWLAMAPVLQLFQDENNPFGIKNFVASHEEYKRNFRGDDGF